LRRILLDGAHASDAHALSDMTWIPRSSGPGYGW
jgi:hypothetical protein